MASFGWSAGDIVATISLVNRVVQCIGGSHDARDHFQELVSELQALSRGLHEISELTKVPGQTPEVQALKFASCSCGETLQRFYNKVRPFEDSLGASSTRSKLRAAPRMVRWELLIKKDVPELRSYLVAHVGALNLRLNTALKTSSKSQSQGGRIEQKQDISTKLIQQLTREQAEMVEKISLIPTVDTVPKLDALLSIAIGAWKSQNEMLLHLAKASHNLPPPDLDHTWAQPPVKFEDALGRRFLIPSEYDWDKIEAVVQAQFKKGPGSAKVRSGDYEMFYRGTGRSILESNFFGLIPGSHITMTIIIGRYRGEGLVPEGCTRIGCRSSRITTINLDTTTCLECQSVFRKAKKVLPRPIKRTISDLATGSRKAMQADKSTAMDFRCYKNVSIYFVELPATPLKFREKYPRDYLPPQTQLQGEQGEQTSQASNEASAPVREPSKITIRQRSFIERLLQKIPGSQCAEPKPTRDRNTSTVRSMLQRRISNGGARLVRLNFHSSAQERTSGRLLQYPLNGPGHQKIQPKVEVHQIDRHQPIVIRPPPGMPPKLPPEVLQSNSPRDSGTEERSQSSPVLSWPSLAADSPETVSSPLHVFDEQLRAELAASRSASPQAGPPSETPTVDPSTSPQPRSTAEIQKLREKLQSRRLTAMNPEYWTLDVVEFWLKENNFSDEWAETFIYLNIHGSAFLELDGLNFDTMHQKVYPRLEQECADSGTGWDKAREREEGKRLRRLIRGLVQSRHWLAPTVNYA
ncbi:hypothetical protein BDZ45DRAFT_309392 [Acephala macrosclerotiorum]|nr:hypothetical protein BDZ45DRAFT_309392 [Acephala macrosclerotiorum]